MPVYTRSRSLLAQALYRSLQKPAKRKSNFAEGVSLLKKSASGRMRAQTVHQKPQNRRIRSPIWSQSGHQGGFSTGWQA